MTTQPSSPDDSEVVFGSRPPGGTVCDGKMQGVETPNGPVRPILGEGAAPVVNRDGLAAYGISCDGQTLGFTHLITGENSRSNPLADAPSESSPRVESVEPLGWSPDGTRLLYRLRLRGDSNPRYYVGALWPAVPSKRTKIVPLPDGAKVTAATFIDDHRVMLAEAVGRGTQLRTWRFDRRSRKHPSFGVSPLPRDVTSLVADHSGLHILALADGKLYCWDRGDSAFRTLADQIAAAAWLGSR